MCTTKCSRYANKQFFRVQALAHDAKYIHTIALGILRAHQRQFTIIQTFLILRFTLDISLTD
jgi:hypothetical protein